METNSLSTIDPSLQALQPMLNLLGPHFSWVIPVLTYLSVIGMIGRLVSSKVETFFAERLAWKVDAAGSDQDVWTQDILRSKLYRIFAFGLNFLFRVNLPSIGGYLREMAKQGTNTVMLTKKDVDSPPPPQDAPKP